jgi:hypothetical protein
LLFREVALVLRARFVPPEATDGCGDLSDVTLFEQAYREALHTGGAVIARSLYHRKRLMADG